MPLDYRRSYKSKVRRRRIITAVVVTAVFVLAAGATLYIRNRVSPEKAADSIADIWLGSGKLGKPLERQPVYVYAVGVARLNPADVAREYVRQDTAVEDSYFDDALFIGDSRTEAFVLYSSLSNINAYCSKGLSITRIYTDAIVNLEDGRTVTVMEALQEQQFEKIYIMFGVNELGWPYDDLFEEQYSKMLQDIRTLQPGAIIYVENIIPISASRSAKDTIYNNENVAHFNAMIEQVCKTQNVIYLDVGSALANEDGALPEDASTDGIHCNAEYCEKWLDFLKNNTYEEKAESEEEGTEHED